MKLERQTGEEVGNTRDAILDATVAIMVEDGYAAVTSRRVAERAGLNAPLIHYHFGSMDDLFVAVYERSEKDFLRRHLEAATSSNPLRALWELSIHQSTRLGHELIALSFHRKSIQKISARVLEQMHAINAAFIGKYLEESGIDRERYPPAVLTCIINALSRSLVNEEALGVTTGRAETLAFADRLLGELEAAHLAAAAGPDRPSADQPTSAARASSARAAARTGATRS